jgi:eukaryotic-like serine/threonine-protein kinase
VLTPTDLGGRQIGRYILFDEVASGGMATVHYGRLVGPAGFSRTVAIKRLHPTFAKDPDFLSMFLDEARVAARIRHPNVVATLDVVSEDGELLLVLEYIHGDSLAILLRTLRARGEAPPPAIAAACITQALYGLHAAHEATHASGAPLGVVHRDVSPQNILVGVDGVARVADFGVAKAIGRLQTTREGQIKGKTAYMSPEQMRGRGVDRRTDVYAASVVLWETLTGRRLFMGDSPIAVMNSALEGQVAPPSSLSPSVPKELDQVVLRGLSRSADQRFATAKQMAVAVEAAIRPAATREVGEWVERVASDVLQKRARRVSEIERGTAISVEDGRAPENASSESAQVEAPVDTNASEIQVFTEVTPTPRRRARLWIATALVAPVLLSVLLLVQRRPAAPSPPPSPSASSPGPGAPRPSAAEAPAGSAVPEEAAPSILPSASAPPGASMHPWSPRRPASSPRTVDCTPPYTFDNNGVRHWKPGC